MIVFLLRTGIAVAREPAGPYGEIATPTAQPAQEESPRRFVIHFQAGIHLRLNDPSYVHYNDTNIMLTWSLVGMVWDKRHGTWGLGARVAVDDIGERVGPMALWRRPLGGKGGYLQLNGGVYVKGNEYDYGGWPGWFLETEIAPNNLIALSLGMERTNVAGWSYDSMFSGHQTTVGDTGWYAGAKLGQFVGVLATAAAFAIAAASLSSSGW